MYRVEKLKDSIPEPGEDTPSGRVSSTVRRAKEMLCKHRMFSVFNLIPTNFLQLTEFGAASGAFPPSKEDERSMALAARARRGDYDDGK